MRAAFKEAAAQGRRSDIRFRAKTPGYRPLAGSVVTSIAQFRIYPI
jgi:hypothetical protein